MKKLRADWIREWLLSFGAEYFVYKFAIKKYKYNDIHKYNFSCCFVRVGNLVAHIEGATKAEAVWE